MALVFDPQTMLTGDDAVDRQHREMFVDVNGLLDAMGRDVSLTTLLAMTDRVADTMRRHFQYEEQCMHVHRCPAAAENRKAHAIFMQVVAEFRTALVQEGPSALLRDRLAHELEGWITRHIVNVDTQLAPCIRRHLAEAAALDGSPEPVT